MGQYFLLVNLTKGEYVIPDLMKLGEIMIAKEFPIGNILLYLIMTKNTDGTFLDDLKGQLKHLGRWSGDRVVLLGDYAEVYDIIEGFITWDTIEKKFKNITEEVRKEWEIIKQYLEG